MDSIKITMKDGTVKNFEPAYRSGGSYSKKLTYEGVFVVIEDEYGNITAIPATDIQLIEAKSGSRRSW